MRRTLRSLFVLTALLQLGYAGMRVLLTYRALDLGASAAQVGLLLATYAAVPLAMALRTGRVIDRGRVTTVMRLGAVLAVVAIVLGATAPHVAVLGLANAVLGCSQMASMVSAQGLLAQLGDRDMDARFATWSIATSLGQTLGIPLVGLVVAQAPQRPDGVVAAMAVLTLLCLLACAVSWRPALRRERRPVPGARTDPLPAREMLARPGMRSALLTSVVVLVAIDLLPAYLPVLAEERGFGVVAVTAVLTARSTCALLARLLLRPILARCPRRVVLVASAGVSAPMMLGVALLPDAWAVGVCAGVAGFVWGLGQPMTMTWVAGLVAPDARGAALALRVTGNRVGQLLVPLGAAALAGAAGGAAVFASLGAMLLLAGAVTARATRPRPP